MFRRGNFRSGSTQQLSRPLPTAALATSTATRFTGQGSITGTCHCSRTSNSRKTRGFSCDSKLITSSTIHSGELLATACLRQQLERHSPALTRAPLVGLPLHVTLASCSLEASFTSNFLRFGYSRICITMSPTNSLFRAPWQRRKEVRAHIACVV
jgi:hypothetical protein